MGIATKTVPPDIFIGKFLPHCLSIIPFFTLSSPVSQITDLKFTVDRLEKERDFYFAKLRDVEIICQTPEVEDIPVRNLIKACIEVEIICFSMLVVMPNLTLVPCDVISDSDHLANSVEPTPLSGISLGCCCRSFSQ
jgi:hypothetical protein